LSDLDVLVEVSTIARKGTPSKKKAYRKYLQAFFFCGAISGAINLKKHLNRKDAKNTNKNQSVDLPKSFT
jgi:hypothetical protein